MLLTTVNTDELTRQILRGVRYRIYSLRMAIADNECSRMSAAHEKVMRSELAACVLVYVRLANLGEINE